MALRPGTRLGTYEIIAALGAGGMGEVYRALDPKLGRQVALKVLPTESLHDGTARARLVREARLAATLNHPNICTVFEVGEADVHIYVAMELIEGRPLSEKIAAHGAGLATENVTRYGTQIAAALAHAHEKHVIHRDLKGSNVLALADGRVKVLDFGLARRAWEAPDEGGATQSMALTETGAIVGTPHYFAPEVLRGAVADERSDLWALGVLLFEMATGALPFKGTTSFELASAIMHDLPATLPERVPTGLRQIIGRCLAKEPGERYARASELRAALEALQGGSGERPSGVEMVTIGTVMVPWSRRNLSKRLIAAAVTAAALVIAVLVWSPKGPPRLNPNPTLRVLDLPFVEITYPGMSSDGRWIAVPASDASGHWGLYFMNLGGGEPREIARPDPGVTIEYADVSPDGSQLAYEASFFSWARPRIFVVPSLGGPPLAVGPGGELPHWSPDGHRVGYLVPPIFSRSRVQEIRSVRADGGDDRLEFADSLGGDAIAFAWSPDGRRVVWTRGFEGGRYQELMVRSLATGAERQLTHDRANINEVWWTRQGELVFSSNRGGNTNLWMMRVSGGPATQITKSVGPDMGVRVSADGRTLLYLQRQRANNIWIGDIVHGVALEVTHDDRTIGSPSLSPDHQRLVVPVREYDPLRSIWNIEIINRNGGERRTIVSGMKSASLADWSPDGRTIAFTADVGSSAANSGGVFLVDTAGGAPRRVVPTAASSVGWVDDSTLDIMDSRRSVLVSARDGRLIAASPDSTFWIPMSRGRKLVLDKRRGLEGLWMESAVGPAGEAGARTLIATHLEGIMAPARDGSFALYCTKDGSAGKLLVPSRRRLPVPGTFPGLTPESIVWLSTDNREFVYLRPAVSSKLLLIQNLR
jgi:eukaryotic-like serine/threonine-protein kinase